MLVNSSSTAQTPRVLKEVSATFGNTYILCKNTIFGDIMGYRWFGRRRGFGLGYGRGLGPNMSPYYRWFPGMPRGWWANPAYSSMTSPPMSGSPYYSRQFPPQLPQQSMTSYEQMQPPQPASYPQTFTESTPLHMNCVYFSDGVCALGGMPVLPYGVACPNFTARL